VNTSLLEEELATLNAQIEQVRQKRERLEEELCVVEAELETFSADRQRFDALQDVCNALDKLGQLKADELFWEGLKETKDAAGHLERVRGRVAGFEGEIRGILEKQASLQEQIDQCLDELDILCGEVDEAYEREERRKEEFVIEREITPVPYRPIIMPWTKEAESERRLRRAILLALLICFVFGTPISLIKVPIADRSVAVAKIPERFVKLVKKEPPRPARMPKPVPKQPQEEPKQTQKEAKKVKEEPKQQESKKPLTGGGVTTPDPSKVAAGGGGGATAARKKAERVGVLAFKDAFADLMDETPVAKLGTEARLSKESPRVAGQAVPLRSLVAMQAQAGSSGGISNVGVSRNVGSGNVDRLGRAGIVRGAGGDGIGSGNGSGVGFGRIESSVFDRYKAALYRIYNRELRKDPTVRGKILLRISIETSGAVSMCKVESTDLASPELVAKIVARIKSFNFGPKEDVPKITILYPIDFLPAG
jgi:hypothetical protein